MREYHLLPPYLVAIVEDNFRDRQLKFHNKQGLRQRRDTSCGVPQTSVWAPYSGTSHTTRFSVQLSPPSCHVICYVDNTLVVAGGTTWERAVCMANIAVACVVGSIKEFSLRMAPDKTKAIFFHDGKSGMTTGAHRGG